MNEESAVLLGSVFGIAIPGTDIAHIADRISKTIKVTSSEGVSIAEKVMDAYDEAVKKFGHPYQKALKDGDAFVFFINKETGVSPGRVKAALLALEYLAGTGTISNATYNPAKYSVAAKVKATVKGTARAVRDTAKEVTPESLQKLYEGTQEGIGSLGTVMKYLPFLAVAGLGVWAYASYKRGAL